MYAVAGIYLGRADDLPIVGAIGSAELWVAFAAWALVLAAMVVHLVRTVRRRGPRVFAWLREGGQLSDGRVNAGSSRTSGHRCAVAAVIWP
jgi:hypothetical protein